MIAFGCDTCATVVKVYGELQTIKDLILSHPRWNGRWPCIRYGCSDEMGLLSKGLTSDLKTATSAGIVTEHILNPEEFFRALCGYGVPEEIGCEPEVVRALLLSASISDIGMRRSKSNRTIVDRIDLDNGTSLHLASSPAGPAVFKITRRRDEPQLHEDRGGVHQELRGDDVQGVRPGGECETPGGCS